MSSGAVSHDNNSITTMLVLTGLAEDWNSVLTGIALIWQAYVLRPNPINVWPGYL